MENPEGLPEDFVAYTHLDTVFILDNREDMLKMIAGECRKLKVKLCVAQTLTEFLAIPFFLAFINPQAPSEDGWSRLAEWMEERDANHYKILLTEDPPGDAPRTRSLVTTPKEITPDFIKFLILKTRASMRRTSRLWSKTERRIVRIMYMLREMDMGRTIRTAEIAREFDVTQRTIQRDIALMEMSCYPIIREKRGQYRLPEGFHIYEFYYGGQEPPEETDST